MGWGLGSIGDFIGNLTGANAADAAGRAGRLQADAAEESADILSGAATEAAGVQEGTLRGALAQTEGLTSPYRQLGTDNIQGFQNLISNPMGFLENNPMFNAAIAQQSEGIKNLQSLSGKAGSGGTVGQLFQNYLATGNEQINQQYNRLLSPIQMGQSAAMNQAGLTSNLLSNVGAVQAGGITGAANAQAGGIVGAANARAGGLVGGANAEQQGAANILGSAAMYFSDRRLKENIKQVGTGDRGLPLYKFNYINENDSYLGYMADEVQKLDPDSVFLDTDTNYLKVSYKYAPVRLN